MNHFLRKFSGAIPESSTTERAKYPAKQRPAPQGRSSPMGFLEDMVYQPAMALLITTPSMAIPNKWISGSANPNKPEV